ncbi:hypothetical protein BGZ94_002819 [Podila epigama]|nr:hypothetical protein BGZ94_002819 [Podila epigama]
MEATRYIDSSMHLTTVQRTSALNNIGCVSLQSLIGDPNLELMVQINYMVDVEFIMNEVAEEIRDGLRTIIYHGLRLTPTQLLNMETGVRMKYPRVTLHHVQVSGIGTHHTKAMLLFYRDNTMQFALHTANMIERDWRNKTQGVFTTGRLSKKIAPTGLATCAFERDLQEYMQRYKHHQEISSRISQFDFRGVQGVLIGSVPGKFSGADKNKWGHLRLRAVLRQQVEISKTCLHSSKIICQISSIGSLGKSSQDWLRGEFETSLNAHRHSNYMPSTKADLCVVFPTAENVRTSYEGWSMGGSLPFKDSSYSKQAHYLNPLLHSWKSSKNGRDRAMPHIKTFTRVTSMDGADVISWFLLTSANLSKPAWGVLKDGTLSIQSYELGVLIFPSLFEKVEPGLESTSLKTSRESSPVVAESDVHVYMLNATTADPHPRLPVSSRSIPFGQSSSTAQEHVQVADGFTESTVATAVVPIRLPYDLPLTRYDPTRNHVWLSDKFFPGQDDYGETLSRS